MVQFIDMSPHEVAFDSCPLEDAAVGMKGKSDQKRNMSERSLGVASWFRFPIFPSRQREFSGLRSPFFAYFSLAKQRK